MTQKHPKVVALTLGELDTNCYIAWCPDTLEAVIIDPADAGDFISEEILRRKLQPTATLLTHGHFDHVLGVLELRLNFDDMPIFMHQKDLFLITQAQKSAEHWLKRTVDPVPKPTNYLKAGSVFSFGNCTLTTIETPGHTPGSVCFVSEVSDGDIHIFCGDTIFKAGVGRTDFSYSSAVNLEKSLAALMQYAPTTLLYPGHGETTTVAAERINLGF
ncbi:MAG: MBL fold metallo-hydrolase [Candidatus Pacebacteria bacterium]|nr:MBL fold metallo-hydrolase [Candidatus Paceibacterota bacterium]PIR63298.1 MAG: MBL fold metallo-hydrolase [Candidatus Pacebacteria bacterium CG10_big_fil_rev_8_21_14_0_10_40_26]PIZ79179.1 MAG: MBL fold metallo-hydrolase [Candidatus Pacebacteria bacterium CG_4_10_14_0_2_um_filter_40_20]PJA68834.1 MAG: MBL fold metallo-hydrolase [Candidatus Pacebacteria bacterium CG_4_9_14_3_um_filter_40_12]PJC42145.1 MAG: MBL fold metallo-hydrolase [Candidatus Pacebacteria bacterium CG_4_9_14_0_2_um_filter_4